MPDAATQLTKLPDSAVRNKFTDTIDIEQLAYRLQHGDHWSGGLDVLDQSTF